MDKIDVIVTSVKPFVIDEAGILDAYTFRQLTCLRQMQKIARYVFVFNKVEDLGQYAKEFDIIQPITAPPQIRQMLQFAADATGSSLALVNGDIFLDSRILGILKIGKKIGKVWAATSFRWENDKIEGQGLDVFIMSGRVADELVANTPDFLTIGRTQWDNWMNGWLRKHLKEPHYFDMTDWKVVNHEPHERVPGRLSNYTDEQVTRLLHDVSCGGIPNQKYEID